MVPELSVVPLAGHCTGVVLQNTPVVLHVILVRLETLATPARAAAWAAERQASLRQYIQPTSTTSPNRANKPVDEKQIRTSACPPVLLLFDRDTGRTSLALSLLLARSASAIAG